VVFAPALKVPGHLKPTTKVLQGSWYQITDYLIRGPRAVDLKPVLAFRATSVSASVTPGTFAGPATVPEYFEEPVRSGP